MKNICIGRHSRNLKKDEDQYEDEVEEIKRQINHLNALLNQKNRSLAGKIGTPTWEVKRKSRKSWIKENRVRAYSNQTALNRDSSLDWVVQETSQPEKQARK